MPRRTPPRHRHPRPIATTRLDALCICYHGVADHRAEEPGVRPGCLACRCDDPCAGDSPRVALVVRQAVPA